MNSENKHAITQVLDQLESLTDQETVSVEKIVEKLGDSSFASLMLICTLITASPASAIPGLTAVVGVLVAILLVQMLFGKQGIWLPSFILNRGMSGDKLKKGVAWIRKPVGYVEKLLKPRLHGLVKRPFLYVPLTLTLLLALFMPFLEVIPASGSVASAVIALFAAGLLTKDGILVLLSLVLLSAIPVIVWQFGFAS